MTFFSAYVYDRCMKAVEQGSLSRWRGDLLGTVQGKVLEIGAGTGASLGAYPPDDRVELFLSEPDPRMRQGLEQKLAQWGRKRVQVLACPAEAIDSEDGQFDYVVASLVCCSVANLEAALAEVWRVLKPGGHLVFLEHVAAAPGSRCRRWQDRLNGLWRWLAGNCHLNRETETAIVQAGFRITSIQREAMQPSMALVQATIRGLAQKV